ncbi:uncharacterized protein [Miscanthus floridulus]|uniref:uncharacterized protein n=1 Tax=Miscanthus floridulus TaxID=154761 RepID=UPI003457A060
MIYKAADKNNGRLHRGVMRRFQGLLDDLELDEVHLSGRLLTWSNGRDHPTLERLDRAFSSLDWIHQYSCHQLRCLSTHCSDHAPLILLLNSEPWARPRFRFDNYWTKIEGFMDVVTVAWEGQLAAARAVVYELDLAQESRLLSPGELDLRRELKANILGLASLERTMASEEEAKADIVYEYYNGLLGNAFVRQHRIDLSQLDLSRLDLHELVAPFAADEVARVVRETPSDRAPGPDGFSGAFYKAAWSVVGADVVRVFHALRELDFRSFNLLNEAMMVLLHETAAPDGLRITGRSA